MHLPTKTLAVAVAVTVTAALGATTTAAEAGAKPQIDLRGATVGTHVIDEAGTAHLAGDVTGDPFDGPYTASLAAADGSLPAPGVCEAATATLEVDGPRNRYLDLTATGNVCGQWTDATYVVTHRFTGTYEVAASSKRKLVGTDGWIGVLLATEGRANVEVFDS